MQTIELDCPPGATRPSDLIAGVLKDTGLALQDFDTGPPFFGEQTWTLKDPSREAVFIEAKPALKERISALYHAGFIRWGSW